MKKSLILIFLLMFALPVSAQSLKGSIDKGDYSDYLEMVELSETQRAQILRIRNEENFVIRPLALDIESKERGLEFLKSLKCDMFDTKCKARLKEDIEEREFEYNELIRKTNQKKNYYKLRYRNVLTREQDIKIQKMIEEKEHQDKVIMERMEKKKKQERIDKLKIWNKFKK